MVKSSGKFEKYDSPEDLFAAMDKREESLWWKFKWYVLWFPERMWGKLVDVKNEIKWFIQRGKYGYSDWDRWAIGDYLIDLHIRSLTEFKEKTHGYPADLSMKRWKQIIDKIIRGFELLQKIEEDEILQWENETQRKELEKLINNQDAIAYEYYVEKNTRLITEEEKREIQDAFILYRKWILSLWD